MSSKKINVLLAEDDDNLGIVLKEFLELKGYNVELCKDGDEALKAFFEKKFDLCLLDVMMPKMDGFTLGKAIRNANKDIPIIFLTAKSMKEDKIEGFKLGGDDYITKPFSMEELELRIEAVLRRAGLKGDDEEKHLFKIGKFTFDSRDGTLRIGDEVRKLTTKESELLRMLCLHEGRVLEREVALKTIWGTDSYFAGRSMDVFIARLRKYLKADPSVEILNVHGIGYKLMVHDSEQTGEHPTMPSGDEEVENKKATD